MESGHQKKMIAIGGVLVALVVIGLAIYFFYSSRSPQEPAPVAQPEASKPSPPSLDKILPKEKEAQAPALLPLVALKESDSLVEQLAQGLSSHPQWAEWLKIKDLIRKVVAATDNIAQGKSPRAHLGFLDPKKPFTVKKVEGKPYINPQNYSRYNGVAEVIHSLNAETTLKVYKHLKPLFQDAYRDLGYPTKNFQDTLIQAVVELLDVPVVEGDVPLEAGIGIYALADEDLEDLSDAQKHLLRMGPENTRKIQRKLREIIVGLGVPENKLPKSQVYRPAAQ
jgi:hypothetical protein